jgi:hypothetical protein
MSDDEPPFYAAIWLLEVLRCKCGVLVHESKDLKRFTNTAERVAAEPPEDGIVESCGEFT